MHAGDGQELIDTRMVATVRCAPPQNKPTAAERDTCAPWLEARAGLLVDRTCGSSSPSARFGWDAALRSFARDRLGRRAAPEAAVRPRRRGAAGRRRTATSLLLGCYHPSQQNTFTGRLTEPMLDDVLGRALPADAGENCAA